MDDQESRSGRWRSYGDAAAYARAQGIRSRAMYGAASRGPGWPADMPHSPHTVYRDRGWVDWAAFLGTGFRPYHEAAAYAQQRGLRNVPQYEAATGDDWPADMPHAPARVYVGQGWRGWPAFLGTGFRPYHEAAAYAQALGIHSEGQYRRACRRADWPADMPHAPDRAYRDTGWVDWYSFLGKVRPAGPVADAGETSV